MKEPVFYLCNVDKIYNIKYDQYLLQKANEYQTLHVHFLLFLIFGIHLFYKHMEKVFDHILLFSL